jgi:hypothetical protein
MGIEQGGILPYYEYEIITIRGPGRKNSLGTGRFSGTPWSKERDAIYIRMVKKRSVEDQTS